MYLKRIELTGFKSFADKTELEFVPGITAVVGPNGSGKSNISDSIRWVLGEQSARSLRGGSMLDVIFAGSDTRKPVNYSEVSLTLDNQDAKLPIDYSEVTITRRLHRSGESEYFINRQACRLKDITELFMDTGIGKEAYSIIGQGRIEEILSTRAEDRRGIFEEASGIVKYKTRKKEAEKKLEETEQNLVRISDLIHELEDQIGPLREQSEKAKKYKQLKEELRQNEVTLYVHRIEKLHEQWTKACADLDKLKDEQARLSAHLSKQDAKLEEERMEARRIEQRLEQLQAELLEWSQEAEKAEGRLEVLKERQSGIEREQLANEQALDSLLKRAEERNQELASAKLKVQEIQSRLAELEKERALEEEKLLGISGAPGGKSEDELKADLLETLNEMARVRNEMRYITQQIESLDRQLAKLDEEKREWQEKKKRLSEDRSHAEQKAHVAAKEIEAARQQYRTLAESIKQQRDLLDQATLTVRKWQQKLDVLVSRRDTMRELKDDYDGFFQGVREVLKNAGKPGGLRGVRGAVAELIKVEEKLETAIEIALGNATQHIVMDDEASSREAIDFLKKRHLGRATFLPLDVIRGRRIGDEDRGILKEQEGFIGIASELIEYDREYAQIIANLLGNVIIANNLECANRIAAKCGYRYRVVTLEGDVVNAGGSMTGGSLRKQGVSLLSRQRKIEALEAEIRQSEDHLAELMAKAETLKKELEALDDELENCRQRAEQKRLEEQQQRLRVEQLAGEIVTIDEQLASASASMEAMRNEQVTLRAEFDKLENRLHALEEKEQELQKWIEQAEQLRKERETARDELQNRLTELKVAIASLEKEQQACRAEVDRIHQEIEAIEEEKRRLQQNGELLSEAARENEKEQVAAIERMNEARIKKEQCMKSIDELKGERNEKHRALEAEESETKELRVSLSQLESQLHQTEVTVNRLDVELDNLLNKLAEEYELSFELAKERYALDTDPDQAQNRVRELKHKIALLGEVNLGAIEEFERISERHRFLTSQKNDLIEAKESLNRIIADMEAEMSQRFKQTFEQIREKFGIVFSRLFGGGRADLILTDPDRPLDTGVDIIAQPPGKKLQNMQLLSGGEKALTAIALLFAILHVKPVPFCVLDEVEAALDEANVARFASYLREFSQQTQFIVVTHRKGTMEEADVLYGVTMEEDGVSKLVSVRLEDGEPVSA